MKLPTAAVLVALGLSLLLAGCGQEEKPYQPEPAYSGPKPNLPAVPTLPNKKKKVGGAYTVWGASHDLRSRVHRDDFKDKPTSIVGWIVDTNYARACKEEMKPSHKEAPCVPRCAIHRTGKADPPDCKAPVPAFYIADEKGEKTEIIPVKGWSSNFAQMFTLIEAIDKAPKGDEEEPQLADEFWGMDLPNPLPNIGARVKVTGQYGVTFTKATGGAAANPKYGIMTVDKIEYLEKPPKLAALPGMKLTKVKAPPPNEDKKKK